MNAPLEMIRITDGRDVDTLHLVIEGMVNTGEGSLDLAQLIEVYEENAKNPSTFLAYANNGRGPVGYIYTVLRESPKGLIWVIEQIYSEEPYVGKGLYILAETWARSNGAVSIRAITSPNKAEAMARLFEIDVIGIVIGKEF